MSILWHILTVAWFFMALGNIIAGGDSAWTIGSIVMSHICIVLAKLHEEKEQP